MLLFVSHHALSVLTWVLTLVFADLVLQRQRATGATFAWLFAIVLMPYVGIPLYLSFGGRKFRKHAQKQLQPSIRDITTSADSFVWLEDGVVAYERLILEIQSAERSIRIATFVLGNDVAGHGILDALIAKAKAGVEVSFLLDDLLSRKAPHAKLRELSEAGGQVAHFMPVMHVPFQGQANLRNHRKMAIFDEERAMLGGMNLANEYLGPHPFAERWKDLSFFVSGRIAEDAHALFEADWNLASTKSLARDTRTKAMLSMDAIPLRWIPSGPDTQSDPIYDALLSAIFRAEKRIWVATPYFIPDEALLRALEVAVRRGVEVRIVVPNRSNHGLADAIGASYLRALLNAGVHVHRYMPGMLHAKATLIDNNVAIVGSANFDLRSLFLNYEISILLSRQAETEPLAKWFEEAFLKTERGMPMVGPARKHLESVAKLFAPLV